MSKLRPRLTYANVMATVAVFLALGGSSYAAISLSKNSVRSKHIAKGAVKRSDIGKGAVNSAKVADSSLLAKDFKRGQLPAGPRGPKGDTGPTNPNAVNAQNADQLDGVDSSQFQRVGLVQAGGADETEDEGFAYLLRWDELAQITTDGDVDEDHNVRIINSGSQHITLEIPGPLGGTGELDPGEVAGTNVEELNSMLIWSADGTRSWLVRCVADDPGKTQIRCNGVANRLG